MSESRYNWQRFWIEEEDDEDGIFYWIAIPPRVFLERTLRYHACIGHSYEMVIPIMNWVLI